MTRTRPSSRLAPAACATRPDPADPDRDALVSTIVARPGSPAFALDWRVARLGGQPRILDLSAEGTSLRLTTRGEYSSVVTRNGGEVAALLTAMRRQLPSLSNP